MFPSRSRILLLARRARQSGDRSLWTGNERAGLKQPYMIGKEKAALMPHDRNCESGPERVLISRLEQLLLAAQATMAKGATLSRADIQRLNNALDEWQSGKAAVW